MLDHWCREIPQDPVHDLQQLVAKGNPREIPRLVNGIDARSNRPLQWTPLQLALAWTDKKKTVETIEELVIQGADLNAPALSGINALHTILLLLFFRDVALHDATMLEWWMSKGVDVHAPAIVLDTRYNVFQTLTPLDLLVALGKKTVRVDPFTYLPPFVGARKHPRRPRSFQKLVALFLCYGATTTEPSRLVDRVREEVATLPFRSMPFLRDYVETRLKLPAHLSLRDLRHRVAFLQQNAAHVDMDEIVQERERRFFPNDDDDDVVYTNPHFEPRAEFMPYEYLGYTEEHGGKRYFFHKSMIPSILHTKENPFTRQVIPSGVLRKWFHEMSHRPYFFRLHLLRDGWKNDALCLWDAETPPHKNAPGHHAILHFVHGVLSHNFPYTNILRLSTLSDLQLGYVALVLGREPYGLDAYSEDDDLSAFLQTTMAYATDPSFSIDVLYFGIEDALLDLSCYDLVKHALGNTGMTFRDPFVEVMTTLPSVGDIIRDRVGYVHLGYFYEIWQRLVSMDDIFS